ncbi:MAG: Hsp20/alpha crystallin family protein [Alphaproteobacteria bacterium]|nr:Hsp20/alpha crystallin family protein [Alphaproteobacteria bacterium]
MTRDPRAWMWAEACEFLDRADRLQRQFFVLGSIDERRPAWQPPVDLLETAGELQIMVALPGVAPDGVQVAFDDTSLIVVGHRDLPARSRGAAIHRIEIPYGRFERRIALPAGRYELDRRELAHGCLFIALRKLG